MYQDVRGTVTHVDVYTSELMIAKKGGISVRAPMVYSAPRALQWRFCQKLQAQIWQEEGEQFAPNKTVQEAVKESKKNIYSHRMAVIGGALGVGLCQDHQDLQARTASVRERTAVEKVLLYTHIFKARRDVKQIKDKANYLIREKKTMSKHHSKHPMSRQAAIKSALELSLQNANLNTSGWRPSSEKEP